MKYQKLHAVNFALAWGIVSAICVFLTTLAALIWGGYAASWTSALTSIYGFLGYNVSFLGAILGAIYGFIDVFIITWVFALIYNKFL